MHKSYRVIYWKGANDEEGSFKEIECLIDSETIKKMLAAIPPKFISVLVDDGEQMIFPTENINTIKQVFSPRFI
ncbi:hypothetical protein [Enterococcus wangshanyuanii]|uniref:Uncharacterized protein n=1 Tax=Enterococcus wangshanyuanii TaxID=2005703 RepID=A0ABQ1PTT4_9ENTE|nr:hypothetical protein [Enterococcus wangshanyuanii]GGD03657.1 hypothetical protein GCM10011573_36400 [Enterococcus wangshanyuanii]